MLYDPHCGFCCGCVVKQVTQQFDVVKSVVKTMHEFIMIANAFSIAPQIRSRHIVLITENGCLMHFQFNENCFCALLVNRLRKTQRTNKRKVICIYMTCCKQTQTSRIELKTRFMPHKVRRNAIEA